jgi:hypothetical protein
MSGSYVIRRWGHLGLKLQDDFKKHEGRPTSVEIILVPGARPLLRGALLIGDWNSIKRTYCDTLAFFEVIFSELVKMNMLDKMTNTTLVICLTYPWTNPMYLGDEGD